MVCILLPILLLRIVVTVLVLRTCSVYSSDWNIVALPRLHEVALEALAVPAISDAVERVLGCIRMRPHKSRLTNKMPSELVFLKCNLNKCD